MILILPPPLANSPPLPLQMFLSMLMAVLGIGGAIYAMTVSGLALVRGPLCQYLLPEGNLSDWGRPFQGPPWKSDDDDDFRLGGRGLGVRGTGGGAGEAGDAGQE